MDYKKKFYLFKQAKSFCSVPWNHIKIGPDGAVNTCSHGVTSWGNIHEKTLEQILNDDAIKSIRTNLFNDREDSNCVKCLNFSNNNGTDYKFLRDHYNPIFQTAPVDYSNNEEFMLSGIDLHWGSTCNLKCVTCWPLQSSSIAQELGVPIASVSAEAANKLIDYIVDNQYSLREVYLSGGEPTLIKHNLRLLEKLDKNINCMFRVNTNMMFDLDNPIIKQLKKFSNVMFTISVDSYIPERFNYIRRGASWDKFISNLDALLDSHFTWRVNSVFFVGTALHLPELQDFFYNKYGINDFTINQVLMGHTDIRCRNLSAELKDAVRNKLLQHREKYRSNLNLYGQLTNCLNELDRATDEDYRAFFEQVDSRAKTNWQQVFQELV